MKMNDLLEQLKKLWKYIWYGESIGSYLLTFLVAFLFIKFIFFPILGFTLNTDFPIVAIVSGSMQHKIVDNDICGFRVLDRENEKLDLKSFWEICGEYYEKNYNISQEDFSNFDYSKGLYVGDVMVLYGKKYENIYVGDVLVFIPENLQWYQSHGPVIHRVVDRWQDKDDKWFYRTKGDWNEKSFANFEQNISQDNVIGVPILRVPFIGYAKIYLNKAFMFFIGIF